MGVVLMAWGPFNFEVGAAAYEELAHSAAARWEKHAIIGRRPAAQYLGPDEESVTLRGTIYPTATGSGSATTIGALLTAAQGSTTYTLMSADGTIVDVYRLERARAVSSEIMPGGAQKIVYDLDFHVHDDGTTGAGSPCSGRDGCLSYQTGRHGGRDRLRQIWLHRRRDRGGSLGQSRPRRHGAGAPRQCDHRSADHRARWPGDDSVRGSVVVTPIVTVSIGGNALTNFGQRVLSGSITEHDGGHADELRFAVSNYDGQLQKPTAGQVVTVTFGWEETGVVKAGEFTVLETTKLGPAAVFEVTAHSADLLKTLKQQKTRSWVTPNTLGAVINQVATDNGLTAAIDSTLQSISIDKIVAQIAEFDMHLCSRLARTYGALFKVSTGMLVFVPRGAGTTASGQPADS